jgi:hypothetical protein
LSAYEGGCACGAFRYVAAAEPLLSLHCQCRDCQRMTGTGHASMMVFRASRVSLKGGLAHYSVQSDSGNTGTRGFCSQCGSFIMAKSSGYQGVIWLTAGSLDDPSHFKPAHIVYAQSAQHWDYMDPALAAFRQMPPPK